MNTIEGGVTAARGYLASAVCAGIRYSRDDIALLVSDRPASVAGVFTLNRVCAAPVKLCREHLRGGTARAVVVNSGCANACTGAAGMKDARRMAQITAECLGVPRRTVFVCSTGTIGIPLPMEKVEKGIREAAKKLSPEGGALAARAIMTTDTRDKQAAVEIEAGGKAVRIGGMAKGSGMIAPNMATMLAFITTDASAEPRYLQPLLREVADDTFNRITVDGDTSTNDTLLMLANGASGTAALAPRGRDWRKFEAAVREVADRLASAIVEDGEGATRFVTIVVTGAANDEDAHRAARAVAESLLVKTSWFGADPNWGRVIAAVGYSGARIREDRIGISYDGTEAVRNGMRAPGFDLKKLEEILKRRRFEIRINLGAGRGKAAVRACDCSYDYVKINSEYMT